MPVDASEKRILRELAKRYSEIAQSDKQKACEQRFRDSNDLKIVRPPVLMDEIPWHEMDIDGELVLQTTDPFAQTMEQFFKRHIYAHHYFVCDIFAENHYPIPRSFSSTDTGIHVEDTIRATHPNNHIVSHQYHDLLADDTALDKMNLSTLTVHPEQDTANVAAAEDILYGILPVSLRGVGIYWAPWDVIPRLHGVDNTLTDMLDRPAFMHRIIAKMTKEYENVLDQYEKFGLLDAKLPSIHCTPAYISGAPADDYHGGYYRKKDMWFRSMAQLFGSVSPEMHWEFDLQYSVPIMEKCAYTYYGCCEALDNKIDILKRKIPNLRKIGVSPWADAEKCAEQIGKDYVLASKPNPAYVAINADPVAIRQEIMKTVKAALKYGCPCEFVLKDISTVSFHPQNLIIWANTVSEVLDQFY